MQEKPFQKFTVERNIQMNVNRFHKGENNFVILTWFYDDPEKIHT